MKRPHAADEAARDERYDAEHYLDGIVHRLGTHGIVSDSVVVPGEPATVLLDEARGRHADLILLATHGRSGLGRLIYGSVAEAVLAKSAVPVFLARLEGRPGRPVRWQGCADSPRARRDEGSGAGSPPGSRARERDLDRTILD